MTFDLTLRRDGAQYHKQAAASVSDQLLAALKNMPINKAGSRIWNLGCLQPMLEWRGAIGSIAADVLGDQARPVRALFFNKNLETNWSLAWHQDRTICVKRKVEIEGYGPWTVKRGVQHVAPPFNLLLKMITLRVHLDDVPVSNAPLLISPGSHAEGRVSVNRIADVVARRGVFACTAFAGDVWAYATPILHASEVASEPANRRVLQIDYAAEGLPAGLEWLGI